MKTTEMINNDELLENEDIETTFQNTPDFASYEDVKGLFDIINVEQAGMFELTFKGKKTITRDEYLEFARMYNSEGEDWWFNRGNWICLFDKDFYERNGF